MKKFIKTLKYIVVALLSLAVLLVVLVAAHPLWLGSAAKSVANSVVPEMTGTGFSIGSVGVNAYDGCLEVRDVNLENPEGYDERCALRLDFAKVSLDAQSLVTDVIHIREITVDGLFVSHVSKDGVNNFDAISANLKKDDAPSSGKSADDGKAKRAGDGKSMSDDDGSPEKKFIIDRISISNVKIKYGFVTIPVPMTIVIKDVGKDSGGATPLQALMEILDQLFNAAVKAGVSAKNALSGIAGETLAVTSNAVGDVKKTVGTIKDGAVAITSGTVDETKTIVGILADGTVGVSSNAVKEVKDLGRSLKDGVKGSFKEIKNIFKK